MAKTLSLAKKLINKKIFTRFRPQIRSRHPSHEILRSELPSFPFKSVIRFGSDKELADTIVKGGNRIELNSTEAIRNSADKLLMKQCFTSVGISTTRWFTTNGETMIWEAGQDTILNLPDLPWPIVAKHRFGSRGTGNTLIYNQEELTAWLRDKTLSNYIFEKFYSYTREYRLHVTADGCFYTCRKLLKNDAPKENKWQRHDDNCIWAVESNESFDKPSNWNTIITDCVGALGAIGLDFGAFDVKVQSAKDSKGKIRKEPKYIIIEVNSAPSFGDITANKYLEILPSLLTKKYNTWKLRK